MNNGKNIDQNIALIEFNSSKRGNQNENYT